MVLLTARAVRSLLAFAPHKPAATAHLISAVCVCASAAWLNVLSQKLNDGCSLTSESPSWFVSHAGFALGSG